LPGLLDTDEMSVVALVRHSIRAGFLARQLSQGAKPGAPSGTVWLRCCCRASAVRAIDNAEREILVGAYGLTTGSGIVEALVRAKGRGVDVRLIADKTTPCPATNGIEPLAAAGVPIWIDGQARIAHAKTMGSTRR